MGNAAMGGVERGTRKALRRVPLEHRAGGLAMMALELARAIDAGPDAKELPALSRELRATLTDLAKFEAPGAKGGKVDEVGAKRAARRSAVTG